MHKAILRFSILVAYAFICNTAAAQNQATRAGKPRPRPNIIYILADDLGYGEVGCYGQTKIRTPNIDSLAARGMRFTNHYSGSPVCAPSRCTLLTGQHTGHAFVRANYELGGWGPDEPEGQLNLKDSEITIAELLKDAGYATGAIGKWGLGSPEGEGHPNKQGFDHWYGYLCQRVAHNYYPTHLWLNNKKDMLEGNEYFSAHQRIDAPPSDAEGWAKYRGETYAPDKMIADALTFIRENKDRPFFLYYATPVPHAAIQVPEESLAEYGDAFDTQPYFGQKGYLPHPKPRAGYAAMVTRMDSHIGKIIRLIDELDLTDHTIFFFSSDNGPTFNGGTDSDFFESTAGLRGLKTQLYEGGIRVPFIAVWPDHVPAGTTNDHISAFWDMLPTICEVAGIKLDDDPDIDGISLVDTLLGNGENQAEHEYLYWEYRGVQAMRKGDWKALWKRRAEGEPFELYNLRDDPTESTNVADQYPDMVNEIKILMNGARTESAYFPLKK